MIKIGILGDIGSGKSYVAKNFNYPLFNADAEVSKLYKRDKKIFFNGCWYFYCYPLTVICR